MTEWIRAKLIELVKVERSSHWLALSFSVGAYIAFSPFVLFHTAMALIVIYLFNLNGPAVFTASLLINNPWTMVPIYGAGYLFGDLICHSVFDMDLGSSNPQWLTSFNWPLGSLGLPEGALWSFFVGGNILGIIVAFALYPIMRWVFSRFIAMRLISS